MIALGALIAVADEGDEIYDPNWALTTRWAAPTAYFEGGARPLLDFGNDPLEYDVTTVHAVRWHPAGDPPDGGWGLYLHIDADDEPNLPPDWRRALTERGMAYVAPHGVGNSLDSRLRIAWALDAMASVEAEWPIDASRRVVGGFSGGGAVATMVGTHWPEHFVGVVDMCRAMMWEEHEISTMPGYVFGADDIRHLDPDWLDTLAGGPRFAFISGNGDWIDTFSNYEGVMDGIGDWWERGLRARVFDVPGLGHEPAPGGPFYESLGWVLDCTDGGFFPPRFDTDHMPPATPFPTPDAAPPEACDPVTPEPAPAPGDTVPEDARGCGCSASARAPASASVGWALLLGLSQLCRRMRYPRGSPIRSL